MGFAMGTAALAIGKISGQVDGNCLAVLDEGPERMVALLRLIAEAQESLRFLYYMFLDDASGARIRDALIAAADRGVKVSLLTDGFGSTANADFLRPLVDSRVDFCVFSPRWGRRYLLRNHQKLALADGNKVIIGGFNISDDYFGETEKGAWRDIGLELEGPAAAPLAGYFDDLFGWAATPRARIRDLRRLLHKHSRTGGKLHWLMGGPTRRLSPWARAVRKDMLKAQRLDIIAAYFAPSPGMLRRIAQVARQGRARLLTAARSDNVATVSAARNTYWWLLKRQVEIFEYQPTKLHTKLFVVDDAVHIGSANFDMRSLFLNLEMMLRIDDPAFAAEMRRFVDGEIADSVPITLESHREHRTLLNRLRWAASYFIVGVADYRISRRLNFRG
ncbi:MAG TPA: phosphatidylserine/phosphatidylglycerophosphate/cardiolipin synthase family protein [Allosphingosinicella sp.]|nr:phosphatidylserine/phosphatidylglycerophosphate/cardiolipin synthase family protein [Allosphingosinicella sp.]